MSTAVAVEIHPLAHRVPSMTEDEFSALRDDIATNGLMRPITLYENKVLDGRHRLRACEETGTEPRFEGYEGDSPATAVLTLNAKRRNLTKGQLAMLVTDFLPDLEREARARQGARTDLDTSLQNCSEVQSRDAASEAGALVGVSPRAVYQAKRVLKEDPGLAEQVRAGDVAIDAAHRAVAERAPGRNPRKAESNGHKPKKPEEGKRLPQAIVRVATQLDDLVASLDGIALRKSAGGLSSAEREKAAESFRNARTKFNSIAKILAEGSAT